MKPKLLQLKPLNPFRLAGSKTAGLQSPAVFVLGISLWLATLRPFASLVEMDQTGRWRLPDDNDITDTSQRCSEACGVPSPPYAKEILPGAFLLEDGRSPERPTEPAFADKAITAIDGNDLPSGAAAAKVSPNAEKFGSR
ncbi:hypothetical protein ATY81_18635 [Rhizobium sp. R72]|uniref:hypothetical protein n=1 Tax=unclassified Rhizobium TaxID=2613769 RepID=UPI000B5371BB|nr:MULTISPECIES: hypothetical protein [unclassified Rhizobium]OWW03723.1 hypothetical protein ATY81_18635 [Rhizobium sp. R72]OWW03930.1 hypothetical protein ATY80_18635 [Rhizobium sp. R711]